MEDDFDPVIDITLEYVGTRHVFKSHHVFSTGTLEGSGTWSHGMVFIGVDSIAAVSFWKYIM